MKIVKKEKYDNNKAFKHSIIISSLCIIIFIIAKIFVSKINGMFSGIGMDMTVYKNNGVPIKTTLIWSVLWSCVAVVFSSLFKYLKCLNDEQNYVNSDSSEMVSVNSKSSYATAQQNGISE